jgi:hypothetical protein
MPAWRRVGDSDLPELVTESPIGPPDEQDSEPERGSEPEPEPEPAARRKPAGKRKPEAKKG